MKTMMRRWRRCFSEWKALRRCPVIECDPTSLRPLGNSWISAALADSASSAAWEKWVEVSSSVRPPDGAGGVNPGDQRALFSLVRTLRPSSVIEIGTHIGSSTLSIAAALEEVSGDAAVETVDVVDVNNPGLEIWKRCGAPCAPKAALEGVGLAHRVRFVCESASTYLDGAANADIVFLDGDHAAAAVYREIPAALRALTPGGVLLLHDYFPGLRPLWSDGVVVPGPYLGVRRLQREGASLRVLPLGRLPWPTKCESAVSSLAVLTRAEPSPEQAG